MWSTTSQGKRHKLDGRLTFGAYISERLNLGVSDICYGCRRFKTSECPNSAECWSTLDKPLFEPKA